MDAEQFEMLRHADSNETPKIARAIPMFLTFAAFSLAFFGVLTLSKISGDVTSIRQLMEAEAAAGGVVVRGSSNGRLRAVQTETQVMVPSIAPESAQVELHGLVTEIALPPAYEGSSDDIDALMRQHGIMQE